MTAEEDYDPISDLPPASRKELVAAVRAVLASEDDEDDPIDDETAENVIRSSEPLWDALDELGLVDSWGGMEFVRLLPDVLAFIRREAN